MTESNQSQPHRTHDEVDPYALIRPALSTEHANLEAEEITARLGPVPAALVLHQVVDSSLLRQAVLASLMGKRARQTIRIQGLHIPVRKFLRMVSYLCNEVANDENSEDLGESRNDLTQPGQAPELELELSPNEVIGETPELEGEFRTDHLPLLVREEFLKTDRGAWRGALDRAIASGVRDLKQLADLIFFMHHRERMKSGVGQLIVVDEPASVKLRAEWHHYETIAQRRLNPASTCSVFLPSVPDRDYERYVNKPTTGRVSLMINGRSSGTPQIEAFEHMRESVESLGKGDSLFIANWQFFPTKTPLTTKPSDGTWCDLLKRKAIEGVRIRVIISDLPPLASDFQTDLTLIDPVIDSLAAKRDNWKYIFSPHRQHFTISHHQKVLVAIKGSTVVAYCGGLDISKGRIPHEKDSFVWHDVHAKLEGLIAREVEHEFVMRWNLEKDRASASQPPVKKDLEELTVAAMDSSDLAPEKNLHKLQLLRTVSLSENPPDFRRNDVFEGYFRLISCATEFLFIENQYCHELALADAIIRQTEVQPGLVVIIVVSSRTDDPPNDLRENMFALRREFFTRLANNIPADRFRAYTMVSSLVHSKLILADDRFLSVGSANANPRDFFLDTQINVMLDQKDVVKAFRQRLWAHDLGIPEATVASWRVSDFINQWDRFAADNEKWTKTPERMPGEQILKFNPDAQKGKRKGFPDLDIYSEQEAELSLAEDRGTRHEWLDWASEGGGETPLASDPEAGEQLSEFLGEVFDPLNPPENVASVLAARDWTGALNLAIQLGMRDENSLANLVFFGKHPELPRGPLDPKDPKFKQLSTEWAQILYGDVWNAIKAASGSDSLAVAGEEVADHDRFFWGSGGKKLKKLVEDAANDAGLNPGLLGTVVMAETRSPATFLSNEKVSSYFIGTDDFWEAQGAMASRVPAFRKVKFDRRQTPEVHLNDAKANPRQVKSILFDSGPDALLATAVYLKMREVRLREIAKDMKSDFDALPIETRLALTRMAMAAGTQGVTPLLKDALAGTDILIRKPIPVVAYQTQRNGTVRTAQAMHLSEWIFGIKLLPGPSAPSGGAGKPGPVQKHESRAWSETQEYEGTPFVHVPLESEGEYEDQVGRLGLGTRKQVTDTKLIPFRWICSIWTSRRITTASHSTNAGLSPAGTGLLISPCHVLTAAHVLKDFDTSSSSPAMVEAETVEVSPGRDGDSTPLGKFKAKSWILHPRWDPKKSDPKTDYAVIMLETCAGEQKIPSLGQPLGFWPLEFLPASVKAGLIGGDILTAGYPEAQHKEMWCFSGKGSTGSRAQDDALIHSQQGAEPWVRVHDSFCVTVDAEKGQSGSPIWAISNGKRYVVGMLVDAGSNFNTAVLLNDKVIQQIQAWINPPRTPHEAVFETYESPQSFAEQTGPSEFEQIYVRQLDAPYIGHNEVQESLEEREDPPPGGLILFDHKHVPKTFDSTVAGGFRVATNAAILKPSDMNPGFVNSSDELVTDDGPSGLQTCLKRMITGKFAKFLARRTATSASANDRLHIGVVDLTGAKLAKPEFAGWGSTVAVYGASSPKMLAVYAAFQLRRDLREMAEDQAIPTGKELLDFANTAWKGKKLVRGFPDLNFLFDITHWTSGQPNDINFSSAAKTALNSVSNNGSASILIKAVGFPYIASVAWQSGLRHSTRGGLWLSQSYDGSKWPDRPAMKAPASVHNLTALSAATFFTLLAQGRLVDDFASAEITTVLTTGGCRSCLFPSEISLEASKCGILKPHMHDCVLAGHMGARYAAAILTEIDATWHGDERCPDGGEVDDYTNLWKELDKLVIANNAATRPACA